MTQIKLAKIIMTFVLLGGSILSFVLDWSANHLLNPAWHPHARFHGALQLFLLAGVSIVGAWLLWRDSREPEVAMKVAAFIAVSFWTPLFYIPFLLPGSTWWAGKPGSEPRIDGLIVYPNLVVAVIFLLLTVVAYRIFTAAHGQQLKEQASSISA
jgi:hypothetical protein